VEEKIEKPNGKRMFLVAVFAKMFLVAVAGM
jgi:hypothetical protein